MLSGTLVDAAHTTGLAVHAYTYGSTDTLADYQAAFALGVDGVFTDNPDQAITARDSTPG
jgi:glycerophosphoryl diester phosphodiesterase